MQPDPFGARLPVPTGLRPLREGLDHLDLEQRDRLGHLDRGSRVRVPSVGPEGRMEQLGELLQST